MDGSEAVMQNFVGSRLLCGHGRRHGAERVCLCQRGISRLGGSGLERCAKTLGDADWLDGL